MLKRQLKWLIGLGCLFVAGCTSFHAPQSNTVWREARDWAQFEASGRMGVKVNERGYSASFDWLRENGVETFDVNTPLGNTVGQLCHDVQGYLAVDNNGRRYEAATAEELSQQLLGYHLPIEHLATWANGEWVKNEPHEIAPDGSLKQLGWQIMRAVDEQGQPESLMLQNKQLTLKLVFQNSQRQEGLPEKQDLCSARGNS